MATQKTAQLFVSKLVLFFILFIGITLPHNSYCQEYELNKVYDLSIKSKNLDAELLSPLFYKKGMNYYEKALSLGNTKKTAQILKKSSYYFAAAIEEAVGTRNYFIALSKAKGDIELYPELMKSYPDKIKQAETDYSKALSLLKAKEIEKSTLSAKKSLTLYRNTAIEYLDGQILRNVDSILLSQRSSFDIKDFNSYKGIVKLQKEELSQLVNKPFNIRRTFQIAGSLLNEIEGYHPIRNTNCPNPVQPIIGDVLISTPDPGNLLQREEIYYVEGTSVIICLVIPSCTKFVGGLSRGGIVLGKGQIDLDAGFDVDGPKTYSHYYLMEGSNELDNGMQNICISLHYPEIISASSIETFNLNFESNVSGIGGPLNEEYSFAIHKVKEVGNYHINDKLIEVEISEKRIKNLLISKVFNVFGDAGQKFILQDTIGYTNPFGTPIVCGLTMKSPDYDNIDVDILPDGIFFKFNAVISSNCFCDSNFGASGKITIAELFDGDFNRLGVEWSHGPSVDINFSSICNIIDLSLSLSIAKVWIEGKIEEVIRTMVDEVSKSLFTPDPTEMSQDSIGLLITLYYHGIKYFQNSIKLSFSKGFDFVKIEIPYSSSRLVFDSGNPAGILLNANENILVMATGLPQICTYEDDPDCTTYTGFAGLPNRETNLPVPEPFESGGRPVLRRERIKAVRNLTYTRRDPEELIIPYKNTGVLLGKFMNRSISNTGDEIYSFELPCAIKIKDATLLQSKYELAFSPNEYIYHYGLREMDSCYLF